MKSELPRGKWKRQLSPSYSCVWNSMRFTPIQHHHAGRLAGYNNICSSLLSPAWHAFILSLLNPSWKPTSSFLCIMSTNYSKSEEKERVIYPWKQIGEKASLLFRWIFTHFSLSQRRRWRIFTLTFDTTTLLPELTSSTVICLTWVI